MSETRLAPHRIREARQRAGLSLSQAAAAIPASRSGVAAWEAGVTVPRGNTVARIAAVYGVDPGFFFVRTDGATAGTRSPAGAHQEG
jgi:transcriptional regulator with XRE-family HTH domain